jgi:hypothetical protein
MLLADNGGFLEVPGVALGLLLLEGPVDCSRALRAPHLWQEQVGGDVHGKGDD